MPKIIGIRHPIDNNFLFSSTTYKTDGFDQCVYCHKMVENDFFDIDGEYVGQPYRCTCEKAKKELIAKEKLYYELQELGKDLDVDKINKITKDSYISEINRIYDDEDENNKFIEHINLIEQINL